MVVYPIRSKKHHFVNLVKQCEDVGIAILDEMPPGDAIASYDAIVDAIFGFSFKGEPRAPFGAILHQLKAAQESDNPSQVLSVDVPSGWSVDEGDMANTGFVPDMLISLTAPKLCTKKFEGRHFIGGRFLPPGVAEKYNVRMPPYEGVSQVMEVTLKHIEGESQTPKKESTTTTTTSDDSWRKEYEAYLTEKELAIDEADTLSPSGSNENDDNENNEASEETWEEQYQAYCIGKEARLAQEDAMKKEAYRKESNEFEVGDP